MLPLMGFDGVFDCHDAAGAKAPLGGWVACFYLDVQTGLMAK